MTRAIVPLSQLDRRAPEAGRIRLGEKTAKAMRAIETFRFTSPHRAAIEQIAAMYGGVSKPWSDDKARIRNQWEVKTEATTVEVYLPAGGLSCWYEKWTGGGAERRCDGVTCEVAGRDGMEDVPCICDRKGVAECRPHTRMNVVLPGVNFYGTWRLESKGWNAAHELPGMYDMISQMAQQGAMVKAFMHLEQRTTVSLGKTKHFVTPTLSVGSTPEELLGGQGTARPQLNSAQPPVQDATPALAAAAPVAVEVIRADIVDEDEEHLRLIAECESVARQFDLDESKFVAAVWTDTDADQRKIRTMLTRVKANKIEPTGYTDTGSVIWVTS
jgi:hypothetical protein